ncbi:ABC transporter ATP-binding protein [Roseivirga sp.]|uniref:ABC transporter ATP-binding protein n=1 Tax=Roseivirga sp. TaxID=1964215 RepID=UPI003B8B579C
MSKETSLCVRNISKYYSIKDPSSGKKSQFWALRDVSFELSKGVCLGLMGSNGSGKSTLLKIINRIITPTTGEIVINGSIAPLLDLGAGFHDELTGRENIYVYGSLIGIKRKELNQKLTEIVDFAEIGPFLDTKLRGYSNGMKVRLAFSVASHLKPDILLADEILAVGDEPFQQLCLKKMMDLKKSGTSIIMVQHNEKVIQSICDRTFLLKGGRLSDTDVS